MYTNLFLIQKIKRKIEKSFIVWVHVYGGKKATIVSINDHQLHQYMSVRQR